MTWELKLELMDLEETFWDLFIAPISMQASQGVWKFEPKKFRCTLCEPRNLHFQRQDFGCFCMFVRSRSGWFPKIDPKLDLHFFWCIVFEISHNFLRTHANIHAFAQRGGIPASKLLCVMALPHDRSRSVRTDGSWWLVRRVGVFHWKDDPCGWGQSDPDQPRFGKDISFGATAYESLKGWWFHSFKRGFADFTPWGQWDPACFFASPVHVVFGWRVCGWRFEGSFESSFWEKLDPKMVPTMPGNNAYQHI